jgi:thiopeptide-type bacteriocin biosynthesis protein
MENFKQAILRLPLLPFETIKFLNSENDVLAYFERPEIKEAIFIASPNLYEELNKSRNKKAIISLAKYLQRASTRCTPFGLFSSCSLIPIQSEAPDKSISRSFFRRSTRFDMDYLCGLAVEVAKKDSIKQNLIYYPNTGLFFIFNKIRYTECVYIKGKRHYNTSAIDSNIYLESLLEYSKNGKYFQELKVFLIDKGIDSTIAEKYLNDIIQNQVLISNLTPAVTGESFCDQILSVLKTINDPLAIKIVSILESCLLKMKKLDVALVGNKVDEYFTITNELMELEFNLNPKYLFQVDLYRDIEIRIDQKLSNEVWNAIKILGKLSNVSENSRMKIFAEKFTNLHFDNEVSLLKILDLENGMGYPNKSHTDENPLLHELNLWDNFRYEKSYKWDSIKELIFNKILEAKSSNSMQIEIKESDLDSLDFREDSLQDTIYAMLNIVEYDEAKNEYLVHLSSAGGSSATNLISRFSVGDKDINKLILDITQREEELNPDIILAEIVHLPESRIGNVSFRPLLRKHEIAYLAKNGVKKKDNIDLEDLMVFVRNGKVFLRSKRLNKIIVPVLSNAHNFTYDSLPIYYFLCDMQTQYQTSHLGLDLGFFSDQMCFVPRVVFKNFIFSRASWRLNTQEFLHFSSYTDLKLIKECKRVIDKFHLPNEVSLIDADNELYINWENPVLIRCFLDIIKKRKEIVLKEFLFNSEKSYIKTKDGSFNNQLILCYHKKGKPISLTKKYNLQQNIFKRGNSKVENFTPGSACIYLKIYSGTKTAEIVLEKIYCKFVAEGKLNKKIKRHFFIRYLDSEPHLRLRIFLKGNINRFDFLKCLYKLTEEYYTSGLISKIQIDTYSREIERYGYDTIDLAEQLFEIDSELYLNIMRFLEPEIDVNLRWLVGMLVIDVYLKMFGFQPEEIIEFTETALMTYQEKYSINKNQKIKIDTSYRNRREVISFFLKGKGYYYEEYHELFEHVKDFSYKGNEIAKELYQKTSRQKVFEYLSSYIHMSVNRFFLSRQDMNEFMIYIYLNKYYVSEIARLRNKGKSNF